MHDFRRTVARDGVEAGNDIFAVMALTGHRSLTTFKRYNFVDTRRVAAAMKGTQDYRARLAATDSQRTVRRLGETEGWSDAGYEASGLYTPQTAARRAAPGRL